MFTLNRLGLIHTTRAATLLAGVIAAQPGLALDYGVFDARALAMGGTSLAIGDTAQAQYYNPALLAFHSGDEDTTRDGRRYFPTMVATSTDTLDATLDAVDKNLDRKLSNAIKAYNTTKSPANAAAIAASSDDLHYVLDKIANKNVALDGFFGFSLSEPSEREGGAFYVGARVIGAGTSQITASDVQLLDDYITVADLIAAGAAPATLAQQYPDIVNANGSLRDNINTLTSTADVSALVISEWGLAAAKEVTVWGQTLALGITPKLLRVDAYRDQVNFNKITSTSVAAQEKEFTDTKNTHITFNADVGIAAIIAEHYRVGIAVKDAFAKNFTTRQGKDPVTGLARPDLVVKLHPRARMGVGYITEQLSLGLDYDLQESTPIAMEAPNQDISLGGEYRLFNSLALRLGYRHDQTGLHANASSVGIGYRLQRLVVDIAYTTSTDMKGGGLQLGWAF